jgi:hypothetical protein
MACLAKQAAGRPESMLEVRRALEAPEPIALLRTLEAPEPIALLPTLEAPEPIALLRTLEAPEPIALLPTLEAPAPLERLRVPPRRWRPIASIGLACGALALLGALLGREHRGAQAASLASSAAAAASSGPAGAGEAARGGAQVALGFITSPPGASVTRTDTGQLLGQTPLEVAVERDPAPVTLRVQLPGYLPLTRQVTFDASQRLELSLAPLTPSPRPLPLARLKRLPVREGVLDPFDE